MPEGRGTRGRLLAAALAAAAVVVSGLYLERTVGPAPPAAGEPTGPGALSTGGWFCPHGGGEGLEGWVVVTNPGQGPVAVRTTTFGQGGVLEASTFDVGPERQLYREVPAAETGASTQVEFFGGWVGAASVVRAADGQGVAAGRCAASPLPRWVLPDQRTGRDQTADLVVMNPFAEAAQFDVVITTEKREIRPGSLSPFVLQPGTSVGIRLNQYVLERPGERTVSAVVTRKTGRIVAGGMAVTPDGLRAELGAGTPESRLVLPAAAYEGSGELALVNLGDERSNLAVVAQGEGGQELVSGVEGISVGPDTVRTVSLKGVEEAGAVVESTNERPVAAALRVAGSGGDPATIGAGTPAARWLVLSALPPAGGQAYLVLQNPGVEAARVSIRLIGPEGAVEGSAAASRTIPAGSIVRLDLANLVGSEPLSAVIEATEGKVVAASAASDADGAGYGATLGVVPPSAATFAP